MKKSGIKHTILYASASILVFSVLFFLTFRDGKTETENVQMVVFGDSVMGIVRDETSVPAQLANLLQLTVYNGAFGGTRIARADLEHRLDYAKDSLSLVGLCEAVGAEDFGAQQALHIRESYTEFFGETVDGLADIDFSKVEIVLIQHGLNDYYSGVPICNEEDAYDEYTVQGALRTALGTLQKKYPNLRIVLATPTYSWYTVGEQTCEEFNAGYGILEDYVNAQLEVAEELGVETIDLYHDFYPHEQWSDWELYTKDGLHPNEEGRRMMAEKIAAYLQ